MSQRVVDILQRLSLLYPDSGALYVGTPYHMIVMVALSARTRDEQILKLAPGFFEVFPTVGDLAVADVGSIMKAINTIGLYRQKAKNLKMMAQRIVEEFGGEVPKTMEELVTLPGVGRKTASVILVSAFGTPAIAVDTHVQRVVTRLGWVKTKSVEATEQVLLRLIPESMYEVVNRVFVPFGRTICIAKPRCWACPLVNECPFAQKNVVVPKDSVTILDTIRAMRQGIRDLKAVLYEKLR